MVNRVLIQTEIDYKIKKRIIHLDENYFWNHEKKKKNRNQSVNINTEFLYSLLTTFYWNTKMQKRKRSIRDRP